MKKALLLITMMIVISCNNHRVDIDEGFIRKLAKNDFKVPSIDGFLLLFVSIDNRDLGCTNVNVLHEVFLRYYSETYKSFEVFLSDALNQKILFSQKELGRGTPSFRLNDAVTNKYRKSKMGDFVTAYLTRIADDKFIVKNEYINDEYLYSILYYCFINSYEITLDDYKGKYFITKEHAF